MRKANTPALSPTVVPGLSLFGFLLLWLFLAPSAQAQCIGTGIANGSSFVMEGLGAAYSASPNVASTDNNYATAEAAFNSLGESSTQYLKVSGFNFSIPSNALICGITVHIRKRASGTASADTKVMDEEVKLIKDGTIIGLNKASSTAWPTDFVTESYSGDAAYWGVALTPADVNDPQFGIAFSGKLSSLVTAFPRAEIDHISMVVEYQPALTSPLSVEQFTTSLEKNMVSCEWMMAQEEAGAQIILQQSTDNKIWKDINTYSISTDARQTRYRQVARTAAKGTYWYRLKLIDKAGKVTYSKTNRVLYTNAGEIKVYPTVAKSMIYIENVEPSEKVQVFNFSNQLMPTSTVPVKPGLIAVRISELPKGMYILKAGKTSRRFIKE